MSKKADLDPALLRRLHHVDGLTLAQIAVRYGVVPSTVGRAMKEAGIAVVTHGKRLGYWGGANRRRGR